MIDMIKVRKIQNKDWKAVKELYNEWRTEGTFSVPEWVLSDSQAKDKVRELLKEDTNLVAEVDSKVCSILESKQGHLSKDRHTLMITQMNVLKQFRRGDIASKLMFELIRVAKRKKIKVIQLYVIENNRPAISFYKKFGFGKTGYIKNKYKFGNKYYNLNIMCKLL
jgi:ribosomal protein S18 acetylase RimI-like enzyme